MERCSPWRCSSPGSQAASRFCNWTATPVTGRKSGRRHRVCADLVCSHGAGESPDDGRPYPTAATVSAEAVSHPARIRAQRGTKCCCTKESRRRVRL